MCPACIASTAAVAAGLGSSGGILAMCIGKLRIRPGRLGLFPAISKGRKKSGGGYLAVSHGGGNSIITILTIIVVAALLSPVTASAENEKTANVSEIQPLPRDLEIQLALSALPPQLRDNATLIRLESSA